MKNFILTHSFSSQKKLNAMNDSNIVFRLLLRIFFNESFKDETGPNKSNDNLLMIALVGVLAFSGVETVKIIFRRNFGAKGVDALKLVACFIVFVALGILSFHLSGEETDVGTPLTYKIAGFFHLVLGFFVLGKGLELRKESRKFNIRPENYQGDSHLLAFLLKDGWWSHAKVQTIAEPLITLAVGILLSAVNPILGIPLIFCAISVWIAPLFGFFTSSHVETILHQKGYDSNGGDFTNSRF
jgi:hypothetical protein